MELVMFLGGCLVGSLVTLIALVPNESDHK